jgi:hypothetical protein
MKNLFLYVDFSSLYIVHVMFISDMFFCGIRGKRVYLLSVVYVGIFFIFYLCATVLFLNVCCPDTNLTWLCENKYPFSWVYRDAIYETYWHTNFSFNIGRIIYSKNIDALKCHEFWLKINW